MKNNEEVEKFITSLLEDCTKGINEKTANERLLNIICVGAEDIKQLLITKARIKQQELIRELEDNRNYLRSSYEETKRKLTKYNADIEKLENFKKNFR